MNSKSETNKNHLATVLDGSKVEDALKKAVDIAQANPALGLSKAIGAGLVMQNFLNQQNDVKSRFGELSLSLDALKALRKPKDELVFTKIQHDYAGTLSGLASVADLAKNLQVTELSKASNPFYKYSSLGDMSNQSTLRAAISESNWKSSLIYENTSKFLSLGGYGSELEKLTSKLDAINKVAAPFGGNSIGLLNRASEIASNYISSATSLYITESKLDFLKNHTSLFGEKSSIKMLPGVLTASIERLHDSLSIMSQESSNAWLKIGSSPAIFANTSSQSLSLPATELYTSSNLVSAISFSDAETFDEGGSLDPVVRHASETIEERLLAFDRDLLEVYLGGVDAIERGGADWQRHSMTSFRELLTQVLHRLSPDSDVIAAGGELCDGRPTRRARLNFIFSSVAGGQFEKFYEADVRAAILLFDLLSGGTHSLGSKATPAQVFYLRGRIAGLVLSMLSAKGY